MKFLCKYLGGSHLYGLNHEGSDEDLRGVYLTDSRSALFGFTKDESKVKNSETEDYSYFEFRYFLQLLNNTNTNSIECLFAPSDAFSYRSPEFSLVQLNYKRLMNSRKLVDSLKGYTRNEARLALGERTGKLGSKRKANLDEYGFSPKNVSHMVRLAYCSKTFLETGEYPVSLVGTPVFDLCYSLKVEPEKFTLTQVEKIVAEQKAFVDNLEDTLNYTFDKEFAADLVHNAYSELLGLE